MTIDIRPLHTLDEIRPMVDLQRIYWGDDLESIVPVHMLFSLANHGGHVLGAFDGDRPVGVLMGFLSTNTEEPKRPAMANLQIYSKRMVVLPEYRGQGIGYRLKLAQRAIAVEQGIRLITWTFDPVLSANAHLNIHKLGAICATYIENYYGTSSEGGLAKFGTSDRLIAEWWVTHRRVEERIFGRRSDLTLNHYLEVETPILNSAAALEDGLPLPAEHLLAPSGALALVEIPAHYAIIETTNGQLAQAWRMHVRAVFKQVLAQGFIVTDFLTDSYEGRERSFYLFSYEKPQFESFSVN